MKSNLSRRHFLQLAGASAATVALAACQPAAGPSGDGETAPAAGATELIWSHFWVGTNPLLPWAEELISSFNEQYDGQYTVTETTVPGDAAHADKMLAAAASGALPDITTGNITLMRNLASSGQMVLLNPYLEEGWGDQFIDDAFEYYTEPDGEIYAIPYSKDNIGIYWNEALFNQAGVSEFPTTWEDFFAASEALKGEGIIPMGMGNGWTNFLMLANMTGTQPGGADFLRVKGYQHDFSDSEAFATGLETLQRYILEENTNEDVLTGGYPEAATAYLQAQAGMIANGPWMINQIRGVTAETAEVVTTDTSYSISPGNGIISIIGEAGFASGASDEAHAEGAVEFMKHVVSPEQMKQQLFLVSRDGPTQFELTEEDRAQIDPLALKIIEEGDAAAIQYPHLFHGFDPAVMTELGNQWPAYAQEAISTEELLEILNDARTEVE